MMNLFTTINATTVSVGGNPNVEGTVVTDIRNFYGCADTSIYAVDYVNNGAAQRDGALNIGFIQNQSAPLDFTSLTISGIDVDSIIDILDYDPDVAGGGLSDVDGDGFFDDIAFGDVVRVEQRYLLAEQTQCPFNVVKHVPVNFQLTYNNACATTAFNSNRYRYEISFSSEAPVLEGHPNIENGETRRYSYRQAFTVNAPDFCDSLDYTSFLVLPSGLSVSGSTVLIDGEATPYTQSGNTLFIFGGTVNNGSRVLQTLEVDLTYSCSPGDMSRDVTLNWGHEVSCACGVPLKVACASDILRVHCPGCPLLSTTGFSVERTTLGFTDASMTTKVTPTTPGLVLTRAYECDTICGTATGATAATIDNAFVRIEYQGPGTDNLLTFASATATVVINGGATYTSAPLTGTLSNDEGSPAINYSIDFDVTNFIQSLPGGVMNPGDQLDLKTIFTINKSNDIPLEFYRLVNFRATHFTDATNDSIVNSTSCDSFTERLNILRAAITTSSSGGNIDMCSNTTQQFRSQVIGGLGASDDFPEEFRPFVDWADEVTLTLPTDVTYVPNSARITYSGSSAAFAANESVSVSDNVVTATFADLQLERHQQLVRTFNFQSNVTNCGSTGGSFNITNNHALNAYSSICREDIVSDINVNYGRIKPNLSATPLPQLVVSYDTLVSWDVEVCNSATASTNTFVVINNLSGFLDVYAIETEAGVIIPTTSITEGELFNLGGLNHGACTTIKVLAKRNTCLAVGVKEVLNLTTGYACSDITALNSTNTCTQGTAVLLLSVPRSSLQVVYDFPDFPDFCEPIPYTVTGTSTSEPTVEDLKFEIDLPANTSLIETSVTVEYPVETTPQALSSLTLGATGIIQFDLSTIVGLEDGLTGINDLSRNEFILRYDLNASCEFDPAMPLSFDVGAETNCDEPFNIAGQDFIRFSGFPALEELAVSATATDFNCVESSLVTVILTNTGTESTGSEGFLQTIIPVGTSYVPGTSSTGEPTQTLQFDGTTLAEFPLIGGVVAGGSEVVTFHLAKLSNTCGAIDVGFTAVVAAEIVCADTANNCRLMATSGTGTVSIGALPVDAAFNNVLDIVCEGTSVNFVSADSCSANTHVWDFGDGGTSTAMNPTYIFAVEGDYIITHTIDNICSEDEETQAITVVNVCPDDVDVDLADVEGNGNNCSSCEAKVVVPEFPSTDLCIQPVSITNDVPVDSIYPVGTNVITWTIVYGSGDINICEQNITVGLGYTTTVQSVTPIGDNCYTVDLEIDCANPACNNLAYFEVSIPCGTLQNGTASVNTTANGISLTAEGFKVAGLGNFCNNNAPLALSYTVCVAPNETFCLGNINYKAGNCEQSVALGLGGTNNTALPQAETEYNNSYNNNSNSNAGQLNNESSLVGYPNPLNKTTTLEFSVPTDDYVTIKIYNLTGAFVANLFEGNVAEQAIQKVEWNAQDFPVGIYLAKLSSTNGVQQSIRLLKQD